jgi:sugar phosphate isomerase/epimerase
MKLACADFTWPLLPHDAVFQLVKLLGFEGIDLGVFGNRSHIRPEIVRSDLPFWCGVLQERLAQSGLALADFFYQAWTDYETMAANHPDPKEQEESEALFQDMLAMARRLGAPGMTVLPGMLFGDEAWDASVGRSAETLKRRLDHAQRVGVRLSVEGHLGSHVDAPEKLAHLLDLVPGLELTLDYSHFTAQGTPDAEIEPLLSHARHFHCRGSAPGRFQTRFEENTIDYRRVIERMRQIDYDGYFAIEYVYTAWQDCNRTENTCETIKFRDLARAHADRAD